MVAAVAARDEPEAGAEADADAGANGDGDYFDGADESDGDNKDGRDSGGWGWGAKTRIVGAGEKRGRPYPPIMTGGGERWWRHGETGDVGGRGDPPANRGAKRERAGEARRRPMGNQVWCGVMCDMFVKTFIRDGGLHAHHPSWVPFHVSCSSHLLLAFIDNRHCFE